VYSEGAEVSHTLWIDLETRSHVNLKTQGVYRYVRCPDFKILMASYSLDGAPINTALEQEEIWDIPGLWDHRTTKVAHNAAFERICLSTFHGLPPGEYLDPEEYHDTMSIARELGYPASLDNLAHALGATPKDSAGSRLINIFCKPNRKGGWNGPDTHPLEWLDFIAYCEQDVGTLMEVDSLLEEQGNWPTETERQVYFADQRINDRGIRIDLDLCRKAVGVAAQVTEDQKEEVRETTLWEVENPGSTQQLHAWFETQGTVLPNLRAETVERALLTDVPDNVRKVLELRQDLALAAPAKFASAMSMQVEGRLRGTLGFFGAHTGRWAGRGTQPHNLPRASFEEDWQVEAAILDLTMGNGVSALTLKKLVRPMFLLSTDEVDDGVVVDYSAIEAVVIAWLAGEEWMLQAFRDKRDIYVETAARMGPNYTRPQGKIASLAFGYNGGAGSLKAMASDKDFIEVEGEQIPLARVPDEILYDMFVWPWRHASPSIVKLWANLDRRFRSGGEVGEHLAFEKVNGNRDRLLRLPSGRSIAYRKAGVQTKKKWNKHKERWEDRQVLTFSSAARYPGRDETYGGRLSENATQAAARDLLAEALVRLEKAGLEVVAHVHDEILVQGTNDVDLVKEIMCELPAWAEGLPVDGDGFTTTRYKKG
jgi:DNA polymerase